MTGRERGREGEGGAIRGRGMIGRGKKRKSGGVNEGCEEWGWR